MARHKNENWNLSAGTRNADTSVSGPNDSIKMALLMDIRDELQTLNRLLSCQNFTGIPHTLNRMRMDMGQINRRMAVTAKLPKGRTRGS